jgi:hypothetical protein
MQLSQVSIQGAYYILDEKYKYNSRTFKNIPYQFKDNFINILAL